MENIFEKLGLDISPKNKTAHMFFKSLITEYNTNIQKFDSPEMRNYFNNLTAAFMLEYQTAYENFDIKVPYRIKSPKSIFDKVLEYLSREDKHTKVDLDDESYKLELNEEIKDIFAMTIVSGNMPPTFASNDPTLKPLIREKKINSLFLEEMHNFRLRLIQNEFSGAKKDEYKYDVSKKEYYYYSIMGIERIKSMIHPNSVNLIKKYNDMLERIKAEVPSTFYDKCMALAKECNKLENMGNIDTNEKVSFLNETFLKEVDKYLSSKEIDDLNKKISAKDVQTVDFLSVTKDCSARLYDKLDLAILSKQVYSIFENSELLKRFGVSLDLSSQKQKRTVSGYVADFVFLDTPFGKIEMQLQTQHENIEGNYGYAAHTQMDGKKIKEFDLPEPGDKEKLKEFQTCVDFISPKKSLAQFDNTERKRIIIQTSGKYQNYKSVISQVKSGSAEDKRLTSYFGKLYPRRDEFFPNPEDEDKVESFIVYDIEQYLNSPEYKKLLKRGRQSGDKNEDAR